MYPAEKGLYVIEQVLGIIPHNFDDVEEVGFEIDV